MPSKSGWSKPRQPERPRWVADPDVEPAPLAYRGGMVLYPSHRIEIAKAHGDALRRAADGRTRASAGAVSPPDIAIVIRPARPEDERPLERLAGLDSASVPAAPLLVAEVDGALRAALSLYDGGVIADPFHRTASLVALLVARSRQLDGQPARRRRWLARVRLAIAGA
jgi:hypothetical protein